MIIIIKLHKRPVLFLRSFIFYNKIAPHGKNSRFPGFSGSTVQQAGAGAAAQTRIWRPNTSSKPPGRGKGVVPPTPRTLQFTAVVPSKKEPEIQGPCLSRAVLANTSNCNWKMLQDASTWKKRNQIQVELLHHDKIKGPAGPVS